MSQNEDSSQWGAKAGQRFERAQWQAFVERLLAHL
jgi:hypothetical protein